MGMSLIDTHCHLNFKAYQDTWREVADRAVAAGVTKMIVVGSNLQTSKRAVDLAQEHPALYAGVGIHPHHAQEIVDHRLQIIDSINELQELANMPRVVAIGEIGLDNHKYQMTKYEEPKTEEETEAINQTQRELFKAQIELAQELDLPMILHSREVGEDVLKTLQEYLAVEGAKIRGTFHCYGGSKKYLKRILAAGFYVGFDGDITYVEERALVAKEVPLDRLLTETDSPYLTPAPYRGQMNEPAKMVEIAKKQAEVRESGLEEVEKMTTANAEPMAARFIRRHPVKSQRALEILPGLFSWSLILFPIWGSFWIPEIVAYYVIGFNIYWLYRSLSLAVLALLANYRLKASMQFDWLGEVKTFPDWDRVWHLVVIPTYKEPIYILERTIEALSKQTFPTKRVAVMISFEVREGKEAEEKAKRLLDKYQNIFGKMWVTYHPDIEGEVKGKSSNLSWGAKEAKKKLVDESGVKIEYVTITSEDADAVLHPSFFSALTYQFLDNPHRYRRIWQGGIMFYNNIWRVPAPVRVLATT